MAQRFFEGDVSSDLRLLETSDNVPLVDLWEEAVTLTNEINQKRLIVEDFLAYRDDTPDGDATGSGTAYWMRRGEHSRALAKAQVEAEAAVRTAMESFETHFGYTRDAQVLALTSGYIRGRVRAIIEADVRNRYVMMLERLFQKGPRLVNDVLTGFSENIPGIYYGTGDTRVPPPRGQQVFDDEHNHLLRTAVEDAISATDLANGVKEVTHHNLKSNPLILCNEDGLELIYAIGEPDVGTFQGLNRYVPDDDINRNSQAALMNVLLNINPLFKAAATFRGSATVIVSPEIPLGYIGFFSQEGDNSPLNPVRIREPEGKYRQLRGLRLIREPGVYFVSGYWERYYATGIQNPGNFVAMQFANWSGGSYVAPDWGDY